METKNPAAVALGRAGGLARAQNLSAKERRASALKASKAAAVARSKRAKAKKALRIDDLIGHSPLPHESGYDAKKNSRDVQRYIREEAARRAKAKKAEK